jgi:hypothetical protein
MSEISCIQPYRTFRGNNACDPYLVDVIDSLVSSENPHDQLTRFSQALHDVFIFSRSKKHMIQRQLGRLELTPLLKYRANEVMRHMPVSSIKNSTYPDKTPKSTLPSLNFNRK